MRSVAATLRQDFQAVGYGSADALSRAIRRVLGTTVRELRRGG